MRVASASAPHGALDLVAESLAVRVPLALEPDRCAEWSRRVYLFRKEWTADFNGEQYALGRAFYTHYETDRATDYFQQAAASDALVERAIPGLQRWTRDLLAKLTGGFVRQRMGFCGPGVHVFLAGGKVAKQGGVVHYDVEGLAPLALARRQRALSLVVMLQPPIRGGGLRLFDVEYHGTESVSDEEAEAPNVTFRYERGDALLMSSYRLHQIRPFTGGRDRLSITLHAVEVDRGVWEIWF